VGIKTANKDTAAAAAAAGRRFCSTAEAVRNDSTGVRLSVRGPPNH